MERAELPERQSAWCRAGWLERIFAIDLHSLALFRILLALVLLGDLYWRAIDLSFFYSDVGLLSRADAMRLQRASTYSLHFMSGSWEYQAFLFGVAAICHLGLLFGFRTPLMAVLSWVLLLSLHRRNDAVLQGGDSLMRALAFWAMFLPLGAVWSIDSLRQKAKRSLPTSALSVASACLLLQVVIVYIFSSLLKTGDAWRVDNTAVYYALSVDQLTKPFGQQLLAYPALLAVMSYCVLQLETFGPLLALCPIWNERCRLAAVILFFAFHIGLALTMELGPFPYICIAAWCLFIPTSFWNRALAQSETQLAPAEITFAAPPPDTRLFYRLQAAALIFFFLNVLCWNIRTLDFKRWAVYYPRAYNFVLELVGLDQQWGMFAPHPMTWDGWYLIVGKTAAGATVNLTPGSNPEDPVSEERPLKISAQYRTERWRKYLMTLASKDGEAHRPLFARALLFKWGTEHRKNPLRSIEIYYFEETTLPNGSSSPQRILLYQEALW